MPRETLNPSPWRCIMTRMDEQCPPIESPAAWQAAPRLRLEGSPGQVSPESISHIHAHLDSAHEAQMSLLAERRLADDRKWIWQSHSQLITTMGTVALGPDEWAAPETDHGAFHEAREHARTSGSIYCEGYRFPLDTSESHRGSYRHAWCLDPDTGHVIDIRATTEADTSHQDGMAPGGWLYVGLGFTEDFLDDIEQQQPGHTPLPDSQGPLARQFSQHDHLVRLSEAVQHTVDESLDEPLPLAEQYTAEATGAHLSLERDVQATGSTVHEAIRSLHAAVGHAGHTRGHADPEPSRSVPRFMGVFDHVGPGVDTLRTGLVLSPTDDATFPVVSQHGDPPPF